MLRRHNTGWIHILGLTAFSIIIASTYLKTKDIIQSILSSLLNFDNLLGEFSSSIMTTNSIKDISLMSGIVLLAFISVYLYIFLIFNIQFDFDGMFSLVLASLSIFILHIIYFMFIDKSPLTLAGVWYNCPYTGLLSLFKNLVMTKTDSAINIIQNFTNQTNLDLS